MIDYPEHDKLAKVAEISQEQGALLEWLIDQGVNLMTYEEWTESGECSACLHGSEGAKQRCACVYCTGTHEVARKREGWLHDRRSIQTILAEYHGINQAALEREKRAMLVALRQSA